MLKQEIKKAESIDFPLPDINDVNRVVGVPKVVTEVDDNGRLISKVVFEVTPLEELNKGLKVEDFALELLQKNGYDFHRYDVNSNSFEDIDRLANVANSLPINDDLKKSVKPHVKVKED